MAGGTAPCQMWHNGYSQAMQDSKPLPPPSPADAAPDTASASVAGKPIPAHVGYDPELLFVECGKCGNPVLWEPGQATRILQNAFIDPLELDAHCLLVTDGCPQCTRNSTVFRVQVFRVQRAVGLQKDTQDFGHA